MTTTQLPEQLVYERPHALTDNPTHYCPGCTHGIAHRLIAEVIDELGIRERTIGIAPVGCAVFAFNYFDCDFAVAAHGRAPAMATGLKRVLPDTIVFTYQGDGDLAAIGLGEILHTAARGESLTAIFINNAIYGMTGGQMAPTSPPGMPSTSCLGGRDVATMGSPLKICELISQIDGAAYVARRSLHSPPEIRKAKKAIRQAFANQIAGAGFSLVELLSTCPTNWNMTPADALNWVETAMVPMFPLGDFKVAGSKQAVGV
ncbi:MAG: 2-oxoglutarate oxidoreductase [Kouleothrix sp.]|jgi:2-oxoglutarate ferredoxin oxidoreductase subunit beta|nr:2-oxoglutarate oxidoreductase [Kouleothrix sp.]